MRLKAPPRHRVVSGSIRTFCKTHVRRTPASMHTVPITRTLSTVCAALFSISVSRSADHKSHITKCRLARTMRLQSESHLCVPLHILVSSYPKLADRSRQKTVQHSNTRDAAPYPHFHLPNLLPSSMDVSLPSLRHHFLFTPGATGLNSENTGSL